MRKVLLVEVVERVIKGAAICGVFELLETVFKECLWVVSRARREMLCFHVTLIILFQRGRNGGM